MTDRSGELWQELDGLLAAHEASLSDVARAELLRMEQSASWRPGRRPMRPDPTVTAFLELFDRAEQQELAYGTLAPGSIDELRRIFRERLSGA